MPSLVHITRALLALSSSLSHVSGSRRNAQFYELSEMAQPSAGSHAKLTQDAPIHDAVVDSSSANNAPLASLLAESERSQQAQQGKADTSMQRLVHRLHDATGAAKQRVVELGALLQQQALHFKAHATTKTAKSTLALVGAAGFGAMLMACFFFMVPGGVEQARSRLDTGLSVFTLGEESAIFRYGTDIDFDSMANASLKPQTKPEEAPARLEPAVDSDTDEDEVEDDIYVATSMPIRIYEPRSSEYGAPVTDTISWQVPPQDSQQKRQKPNRAA